ncbi:MAG: alpha/beta fold hydrolase [Acidimicrobiales bacterium]
MSDASPDPAGGETVDLGPVSLWVDVQGPDDGEVVLLIAGADSPGLRWTPAFVAPLVADGWRVVRFDHRDCGRSTRFGPDDGYLLDDLTADAVALLDHLGVARAHVVGRSMGGMIGQLLALDHPERVRSLTLLGTSPDPANLELGGPADDFVDAMMTRLFAGPPGDVDGRTAWLVELDRLLHGPRFEFDEARQRRLARAELDWGWAPETGHGVAVHASPSRLDRLAGIGVPTLVVHGDADPVFPLAHGRALAEGIPGAALVEVTGLGHEVPDELVPELLPALLHHLRLAPG